MIKTKKNNFLKAAFFMLLAVMMLSTSLISMTIAKYSSKVEISSTDLTLNVANWDIKVAGSSIKNNEINLNDIIWTIMSEKENNSDLPIGENTIAPGTWGFAEIKIENASDVDAIVKISYDVKLTNEINEVSKGLSYKDVIADSDADPAGLSSYEDFNDKAEIPSRVELKTKGIEIKRQESISLYICYQWLFEKNEVNGTNEVIKTNVTDPDDTKMAENGVELVFSVSLSISAEQSRGSSVNS